MRLSYESWDSIFDNNECTDLDSLFISFLKNYLRIFSTSFPNNRITKKSTNNTWITTGIKISCNHKKYLHLLTRNNDDPNLKNYYCLLTNSHLITFMTLAGLQRVTCIKTCYCKKPCYCRLFLTFYWQLVHTCILMYWHVLYPVGYNPFWIYWTQIKLKLKLHVRDIFSLIVCV
jgi:hypothetical protein